MFDSVVSLFLVGLGLRSPSLPQGDVRGEETEVVQERDKELGAEPTAKPEHHEGTVSGHDVEKKRIEEQRRLNVRKAEELKKHNNESREGNKHLTEEQKAEFKTRFEAHKKELKEHRSEFLDELKVKRAEAKEEFKEERLEFKEKLDEIKDEKKKEIVEKIDGRMQEINVKRTTTMTSHLNKMSEILGKVLTRAEASGEDATAAETAVDVAKSAIDTAATAVTAQAGKEYVIDISSESKLGTDVSTSMKTLSSDLFTVHKLVVTARQRVADAIAAVGKLKGGTQESSQSGSGVE